MDLIDLDGCHLSTRKLFDAAQCGGWDDIIFVLYFCRETSRKTMKKGGVGEVSHVFCISGKAFNFILLVTYFEAHYVVHVVFCYL